METQEKEAPQTAEQPQPQASKPETTYRLELDYDMLANNLVMRSRAPTVVVSGILRRAEYTQPETLPEEGTKRRIIIDYDMATDETTVKTDAPTIIFLGILAMAHSMMTQNQVLQRLQGMQAQSKIIRPS